MDRKADMLTMRSQGYKLCEIAKKYGISRERVRQIIGNTGYLDTPRIANEIESSCDTDEELINRLGVSYATIYKYRNRSGKRHKIAHGSTLYRGTIVENLVSEKLNTLNIKHELMPHHHPFDILVAGKIKIDVKSSYKQYDTPNILKKMKSPAYSFKLNVGRKQDTDFYIFVIVSDDPDCFVVPSIAITPKYNVRMAWPTSRPEIGKYQKYHERWDLLINS